jgi:CHAT domain-containing protein
LGQERSYVFAITQNDLKVFQLPKRADVEAATRKVYNLLTALNHNVPGETPPQTRDHLATAEPAYVQSLMQLSQMVLGPVAEQLQGKRLLVVADGALQYIPFQAMPEPQAGKKTIAGTATPLIVQHEVVNLPSASVLAVLRQQAEHRQIAPRVVAVLADPVFDRGDARIHARSQPLSKAAAAQESRGVVPLQDDPTSSPVSAGLLTRSADDVGLRSSGELHLPRLLYSRQEADSILALTPRGQGMETVDFKANRAAAMDPALSQYRIVHFATHGLLNSEHPEFSGLVFSLVNERGKAQDGFLQLQDIYNLNLSADVVVLSSCETALGKEISGEGLVGLTRGFMYAGATRVVASLWNVSDAATARLMADFYRAMEHDGLRPAAALRSAQIQMWKQKRWSSPYFWAAFQIQGEWR